MGATAGPRDRVGPETPWPITPAQKSGQGGARKTSRPGTQTPGRLATTNRNTERTGTTGLDRNPRTGQTAPDSPGRRRVETAAGKLTGLYGGTETGARWDGDRTTDRTTNTATPLSGVFGRTQAMPSTPAIKIEERPLCETCEYFQNEDMTCHRRAPLARSSFRHEEPDNSNGPSVVALFPLTLPDGWCGEHSDFGNYLATIEHNRITEK